MLTYILFPIGLLFLIKGADYMVSGASSLAKKWGVSSLVIGLTIVAFGTSAPELIVNIMASINGNTDLAIGNILGSNIANIFLILGISAIIFPLTVKKATVWKEIPLSLLAVVVISIMANDSFIDGGVFSGLTRTDGLVLMAFFSIFLYYTFGMSKEQPDQAGDNAVTIFTPWKSVGLIVVGITGLTLGGKWIVDAAVQAASAFGISEALIGLTVVAVGTSLPELATSAVAAYKKDVDIAVGNIIGSNVFNIFWILGVSATMSPLPFAPALMRDIFMAMLASFLLFMFMFVGRKHTLERWQGVGFVAIYVAYIIFIVIKEIM